MKNVFFILKKKRNRLFGQSDSIFNIKMDTQKFTSFDVF